MKMDRPLISYVVTTYNIENYVEEAVKCAFAQTYSPLEIILSDDCSTDRTYEIIESLAREYNGPHKIVLNRNENNLGITRHMNKAYLELATGEIIIAAHGDDISKPERTQLSYDFLSTNPDFTAVSFSIEAVDSNNNVLNAHSAIVDEAHTYDFNTGGNIPAPSRAFYKNVMTIFGPLNDDCPTEDELISFRALLLGKNAFLPQCMVKYRKHEGSSSNPENFSKFPLEKILKQQNDDMRRAVDLGLISEEIRLSTYKTLERNMLIRRKYRTYYADRSWANLFRLVLYRKVSIKKKIHYFLEHMRYLN